MCRPQAIQIIEITVRRSSEEEDRIGDNERESHGCRVENSKDAV